VVFLLGWQEWCSIGSHAIPVKSLTHYPVYPEMIQVSVVCNL
jgi:hypothetical protein